MAGTNTTTQDKDFLDNATELVDKIGKLGASFTGNPLLMAGVEAFGRGIKSWAAGRNIDTGPFDARMASVDATVKQARDAYAEYQKRHGSA